MRSSLAVQLGSRVRERRQELGWTQEQLADRLGVEVNTVSRMECGIRTPSLDRLGVVADVLDVSVASLLGAAAQSSKDQADVISRLMNQLTPPERALIVEMVKLQAGYFQSGRKRARS